jgi:hypothetical protein
MLVPLLGKYNGIRERTIITATLVKTNIMKAPATSGAQTAAPVGLNICLISKVLLTKLTLLILWVYKLLLFLLKYKDKTDIVRILFIVCVVLTVTHYEINVILVRS